jgi:hypothetical protein
MIFLHIYNFIAALKEAVNHFFGKSNILKIFLDLFLDFYDYKESKSFFIVMKIEH